MNRLIFTGTVTILFFFVSYFISCKQDPEKKELWAVVINFFSPDTANYPATKKFPFPDSLKFAPLGGYFINKNIPPIISDSNIIFQNNYRVNGQTFCCKKDTLEVYIDTLKGKKYLFAIGEYVAVFQSNSTSDTNLRTRVSPPSIPLWNIKLNTPYSSEKFKDEYEKLGAKLVKLDERFDEVSKQRWNDNDSIFVETIQFRNSGDRIITAISKDMNDKEVESTINYLRNKFPYLTYEEAIQPGSDGMPLRVIRINFQGVSISITQVTTDEYSFEATDYYGTIKLILHNAGSGYIFRDDIKIY